MPIYHYGEFWTRTLAKLSRRYDIDADSLIARLVNVNSYIYGKVYFPVYSNRLEELGVFVGATWTEPKASGLRSLVWRYQWEMMKQSTYKEKLVVYNLEDCIGVQVLANELDKLDGSVNIISEVDFINRPKLHTSSEEKSVHNQFEAILKFANAE